MKKQMQELQSRMELNDESSYRTKLETEKREKRALEKRVGELEKVCYILN